MDYERLAARHKDAVYRQMVRVCGNREDAEDVLVEALISAFKAKDKLRDEAAFQGWLSIIGRRVCGKLKKHEALRQFAVLSDDEGQSARSFEEELDRKQLRICVQRAIDALPAAYREVYEMRELDELTAEETSKRLKLSLPAVKSRLHRARAMVRGALDREICG